MNDDKPLSAFYASIDISKGKMFYIPRCIRVSSRKIHLKYSFTLINSFMIWCTEDCLSTSLEIIEVKPTRKLIELLMLCGCCMLCCPHPCLIICTLMLMQIEDYCVFQMFRHYILCLCILLVFIYKDVHVGPYSLKLILSPIGSTSLFMRHFYNYYQYYVFMTDYNRSLSLH